MPPQRDIPEGHALIRVEIISLCGSDFKLFLGSYAGPAVYPICFGHEWAGTVQEIAGDANGIKAGDRVTGDCSRWCGQCRYCRQDKNLCLNIEKFGITVDGYSQELAVTPVRYLYRAPDDLDSSTIALTECFAVGLHAIRKLPGHLLHGPGYSFAILGGGPVGLSIALLLKRLYRCGDVSVLEISPVKRALIEQLLDGPVLAPPATGTAHPDYMSLLKAARYDVIFEAVGTPGALQTVIELARPNGYVVCLGMSPPASVDFLPVVAKSLHLTGSIGGTGEFEDVLSFLYDNRTLARGLITGRYSLEEAERAFTEGNAERRLKTQIQL